MDNNNNNLFAVFVNWFEAHSVGALRRFPTSNIDRRHLMHGFKIGDHVSWNSEAGRVSGTIIRVHTSNFDVKGYTHHASVETPQYEIKSSKTEHIAFHKGSALARLRD
jgi:Hypervirulence associated proteins TUDOR domain